MADQQRLEYEKLKAQKEKQLKRQNDYIKSNYDRLSLALPKGDKKRIEEAAAARGFKSLTDYIKALIENDLKKDQ